jgi:hypothetical protein
MSRKINWLSLKINWLGLSAGIITLIVLAVSLYLPWWQFTVGQNLIRINASPVYTNFGLLSIQFTVPVIWALNLISILTFAACGVVMLVYSLVPTKPYAKQLLSFSYRKPLYTVVSFAVILIIIVLIAGHFGLNIPLMGSATLTVPGSWTSGATISALVSGNFELPFWLAIVAAALCMGARLYHSRVAKAPIASGTATAPTGTTAASV